MTSGKNLQNKHTCFELEQSLIAPCYDVGFIAEKNLSLKQRIFPKESKLPS